MFSKHRLFPPEPLTPRPEAEIIAGWKEDPESQPRVSVICHAYNHAPYIRDAINGVLAQVTTFSFELIVHDDASTDGTREILEEHAKKYPQLINLVAQEVNQYSQGRRPPRFSYPQARGEYIALCDGDDYWIDRHKLSKQVKLLDKYTNICICGHPEYKITLPSRKVKLFCHHGNEVNVMSGALVLEVKGQLLPTTSLMFKTCEAKAMPDWFFHDRNRPNGDLLIKAIIGRAGILYTPDVMSVYRSGVDGSYTNRFREKQGWELARQFEYDISFTRKLAEYREISAESVEQKVAIKERSYALRCILIGDFERYLGVTKSSRLGNNYVELLVFQMAARSRLLFRVISMCFKHGTRT